MTREFNTQTNNHRNKHRLITRESNTQTKNQALNTYTNKQRNQHTDK